MEVKTPLQCLARPLYAKAPVALLVKKNILVRSFSFNKITHGKKFCRSFQPAKKKRLVLRSAPTGKKDDCAIGSEKKKERIGAGCSETQSKFLYK